MAGPMNTWKWILTGYLLAANLFTFCLFGADKRRAKRAQWRIPEKKLFRAAWMGGAPGAWAGMKFFHHKTLHNAFRYGIPAITLLWTAAAIALLCFC